MLAAVYGEFLYFLVPAGIINWQEENSHKIQKAFFFHFDYFGALCGVYYGIK